MKVNRHFGRTCRQIQAKNQHEAGSKVAEFTHQLRIFNISIKHYGLQGHKANREE
jgi:hypothetical protein